MKSNNFNFIAVATLSGWLVCGALVNAQDTTNAPTTTATPGGDRTPRGAGAKALKSAFAKLDLTAEEKPKVEAAVKERTEKTAALRADTSVTGADRRAKAKEINDAFETKLKSILTPDQYKKWEEVRPATRATRRGDAGGRTNTATDSGTSTNTN